MSVHCYVDTDWTRRCAIHDAARKGELTPAGLSEAFLSLEQTAQNQGLLAGAVLVHENEADVQGFVAFSADEIAWLDVESSTYRRGIGRLLLPSALARCDGPVSTAVLVGNERALPLCLVEGFSSAGRRKDRTS